MSHAQPIINVQIMDEDFAYQLRAEQEVAKTEQQTKETQTYTDPTDGTVYEWDEDKRAWFPKIDTTFLAAYHASYGFYQPDLGDTTATGKTETNLTVEQEGGKPNENNDDSSKEVKEPEVKKKKTSTSEPSWFDIEDERNTNVYVSGLPLDITLDEFKNHMSKCGIIMEDDDGDPKIKLYRSSDGELKGDGLCCYLKIESVQLAIDLLDETEIRKGFKISVKKAKFELKGEYNPSLKKKKQNKKKKKINKQERLLDWKEKKATNIKPKHNKIIIFKNLFDPKEFDDDPVLITDIRDDLREECSKIGEVKKVLIFDRHVDGIGSVAFKEFEAAEECAKAMNGRYYGGKQLEVFEWDGVTNYQVEETEKEREVRLKKWEDYISKNEETEISSTIPQQETIVQQDTQN